MENPARSHPFIWKLPSNLIPSQTQSKINELIISESDFMLCTIFAISISNEKKKTWRQNDYVDTLSLNLGKVIYPSYDTGSHFENTVIA